MFKRHFPVTKKFDASHQIKNNYFFPVSVFYPLLLRVCAKFQANFNLFSFYVVYASGLWVDIEISGVQKSRFVLRKLVGQKKPPKVGHYLESYHSHFPKCTTPCNPKKGVLGGGYFSPLQK